MPDEPVMPQPPHSPGPPDYGYREAPPVYGVPAPLPPRYGVFPATPQPAPPSPPPPAPPSRDRMSRRAMTAGAALVGALLLAAAVVFILPGPHVANNVIIADPGAPTPLPTGSAGAELASLRTRYQAAAGDINVAYIAFFAVEAHAQSQPCSCPPGDFDGRPVVAALPAFKAASANFQAELQLMAQGAPTDTAADLEQLVLDDKSSEQSILAVFGSGSDVSSTVLQTATDAFATEHRQSLQVRSDLGLPPPSAAPSQSDAGINA